MTLVVTLMAATGLVIFSSGLPVMRRRRVARQVEPYLRGMRGRSSGLIAGARQPRTGALAWINSSSLFRESRHEHGYLSERLRAAGTGLDPSSFRLEQLAWAAAGGLSAAGLLIIWMTASASVRPATIPVLGSLGAALGFFGRDWWLSRQSDARAVALGEELPTAIDLITLSIMSGESVPAAFARVASHMPGGIGLELQEVVDDMRVGKPVVEALEELPKRVPDPAVGRLVDALCIAIERGAPLADVLRNQADDVREARKRQLLESGGRREVLMLVPVVFLIMPVVVVFALLPGLVSLDLLVP